MDEYILPFDIDTNIRTYPYLAFYLGILEGNKINTEYILINEFITTFYFRKKLDFAASGFFQNKYFNNMKIDKKLLTVDNLKMFLKQNKYVVLILNERFISNKGINKKNDYYHDWLIIGYSDVTSCFICAGYSGEVSKFKKYKIEYISYNDIAQSIKNSKKNRFTGTINDSHTIEIKNNIEREKIRETTIKRKLFQYSYFNKFGFYFRPIINLGYLGNMKMLNDLKRFYANYSTEYQIFMKGFRIFYENKIAINIAINKMNVKEELKTRYKNNVLDKSYLLFLKSVKYNVSPNQTALHNIISDLDYIIREEKFIIRNILFGGNYETY